MSKTGVELIAQEREEQLTKHGRVIEHDVLINSDKELGYAASFMAYPDHLEPAKHNPGEWDEAIWSKMMRKEYRKRLIIAGALIAAELDRLNYLDNQNEEA